MLKKCFTIKYKRINYIKIIDLIAVLVARFFLLIHEISPSILKYEIFGSYYDFLTKKIVMQHVLNNMTYKYNDIKWLTPAKSQ